MRWLCLLILMLSCAACADSTREGRAAAILDQVRPAAVAHAGALTAPDVPDEVRRTGLPVVAPIVNCWPDGCPR